MQQCFNNLEKEPTSGWGRLTWTPVTPRSTTGRMDKKLHLTPLGPFGSQVRQYDQHLFSLKYDDKKLSGYVVLSISYKIIHILSSFY